MFNYVHNLKINFLKFFLILTVLIIIYFIIITKNTTNLIENTDYTISNFYNNNREKEKNYNVWLVFTKITFKSPLPFKFQQLLLNILNISSIPLKFHIIIDNSSKELAITKISNVVTASNKAIYYKLYDIEECAKTIQDIVQIMTPHFSSKPGTYYSDALFYLSLGLYRIAPKSQSKAILLDCDLYFKQDIALLFKEFDRFKPTALYGLAPELSPIYRHILHIYKSKHKNTTTFGDYYQINSNNTKLISPIHPNGFQGYNSGVVLINLSAIRKSMEYSNLLKNQSVELMTNKYHFRGHLGDQDFYTLIGYEYPHLIQTLHCGFNRQLCTWWRDHGYTDVFRYYFKCKHPIIVLHGNCRTRIPKD